MSKLSFTISLRKMLGVLSLELECPILEGHLGHWELTFRPLKLVNSAQSLQPLAESWNSLELSGCLLHFLAKTE